MCSGLLDSKAKQLQAHIPFDTFQNLIRFAFLFAIEGRTNGLQGLHKVISMDRMIDGVIKVNT